MNSAAEVATQYRTADNLKARIGLHERFGREPLPWTHWVVDQLALPPVAQILEVGCGTGKLWAENLMRLPTGWSITLTDQSVGMLAQSRQTLNEAGDRFHFAPMDMQTLTFADATFDAVIANHMLYHVPDLGRGLAEIGRVLKPGGVLLAATNGDQHMIELHELVHRFDPQIPVKPWRLGFSLENGAELLAPYFRSVELRRFWGSSLHVTEAAPLVAYVASMSMTPPERLNDFQSFVEATLQAQQGVIVIGRDAGVFMATE